MFLQMNESVNKTYLIVIFLLTVIMPGWVAGQQSFDTLNTRFYVKKELTLGALYRAGKEREELFTNVSKQYEEISTGEIKFQFRNRYWTFLDFKQEQLELNFEAGSLWGNGNWVDSSYIDNRAAGHSIIGFRANGSISYANRFYYDDKSFTLVRISAAARYDLFHKHSEGTLIDSNNVSTNIDVKSNQTKFRYMLTARAGWGTGRLNPVNHLMVAEYILDKYYKGKTFSKEETNNVVRKIEEIKNGRNVFAGHDINRESEQIVDFLNRQMFLTRPERFESEWEYGEFLPRFNGSRLEIGPFFKYYNREPDFVYGGYIQYNNEKYQNYRWNRKFNVGLNYNWYKKQDWMIAEIELGWSYFMKLKSEFDFGIRYVPGITLNYFEDIGKLNHSFIPYIGYYSQLNESTRINLALAYRITENEEILLPGPEISVSIYRSKY